MAKKKKNGLLIAAAVGIGAFLLSQLLGKKKSAPQTIPQNKISDASPQEKSTPSGTNSAMRTLYLDYIKQFLLREDYSKNPDGNTYEDYAKLFSSMTTDELEASYRYMKDYLLPRAQYNFGPSLDPASPLGIRIMAIKSKYMIF